LAVLRLFAGAEIISIPHTRREVPTTIAKEERSRPQIPWTDESRFRVSCGSKRSKTQFPEARESSLPGISKAPDENSEAQT
jgi:hypothetical protein